MNGSSYPISKRTQTRPNTRLHGMPWHIDMARTIEVTHRDIKGWSNGHSLVRNRTFNYVKELLPHPLTLGALLTKFSEESHALNYEAVIQTFSVAVLITTMLSHNQYCRIEENIYRALASVTLFQIPPQYQVAPDHQQLGNVGCQGF